MVDIQDRRILSSRDILSNEFYEIDMAAIKFSVQMDYLPQNRTGYRGAVRQMRRLLNYDIKKLRIDRQKEFTVPEKENMEQWIELHTKLTDLAREIGIVGKETAPFGDSLLRK